MHRPTRTLPDKGKTLSLHARGRPAASARGRGLPGYPLRAPPHHRRAHHPLARAAPTCGDLIYLFIRDSKETHSFPLQNSFEGRKWKRRLQVLENFLDGINNLGLVGTVEVNADHPTIGHFFPVDVRLLLARAEDHEKTRQVVRECMVRACEFLVNVYQRVLSTLTYPMISFLTSSRIRPFSPETRAGVRKSCHLFRLRCLSTRAG